jgi:hypothetical protein
MIASDFLVQSYDLAVPGLRKRRVKNATSRKIIMATIGNSGQSGRGLRSPRTNESIQPR